MTNQVIYYRINGKQALVGINDWHRIAKQLDGYGFRFEKISAQHSVQSDLGSPHAFKNDVCEFCGRGLEFAFQPCPSR